MSVEWYDLIAKRNNGYKSDAVCTVEGRSGEAVFEERLIRLVANCESILDAGCGHGEFTLRMAQYARNIIGFDNSTELLKIADDLKQKANIGNVNFIYGSTKAELPFQNGQFDLIYDRRGPTSIIKHPRIMRPGGMIFGIHSAALDKVMDLLAINGFSDVKVEEFNDAMIYFPNKMEFAKYLSANHGNPDYTLLENRSELEQKVQECTINGRIGLKEWRYIWQAVKK